MYSRLNNIMPITIVLLVVSIATTILNAQEVYSPNGSIKATVNLEAGNLYYEIFNDQKAVIERSPLGLETSIGSFYSGLTSKGFEVKDIHEHYNLPHGKVSEVAYNAKELVLNLTNKSNDELKVIFRVSNRDVAFSYIILSKNKRRVVIEKELTGFDLPDTATAFVTPQVAWGGGYMKTKPSYEEGYMLDVPVSSKSWSRIGFTFPALFRLGNDGWVLVSETGVSSNYVGSRLSDPTPDGLYKIAFPEKEENGGLGSSTVSASLPLQTPWRTITIGKTLAPIVETNVATDVVKPLYEPRANYKPGLSTWSWILWQDGSMNEKDQRTYIDLAAKLKYEYILIDAFWDSNIGREKMAELVKYANSKNVDVILWYNSNGHWNDAPQTPRNCMDSAPARHNEMAWLKSIGVKGMKVDFFGGDKQMTMELYEDILTDANVYGLMLNFHGATLPRGWERMYPNFMTSEAVTASENLIFSQGVADKEAFNSTIFPFVRNPVAAMDYGPVLLNKVFSRDQKNGSKRRTSDTFQLATAVLFQSPIQHFGITPNNMDEQPGHVVDFLKHVPASWDETRFVDGYPGKYVVLARRSGDSWYIAATHAEKARKDYTISLPWLKGEKLNCYYDDKKGVGLKEVNIADDGSIKVSIDENGGVILVSES